MDTGTYLHNPRCSKSREGLALLRARGIEPKLLQYLDTPLSAAQIDDLLQQLGFDDPRALIRRSEAEYADLGLADPARSRAQLIAAMVEHPRLIERPVFARGCRAVIGRPPERLLELLD